jgi:hypothetical protein
MQNIVDESFASFNIETNPAFGLDDAKNLNPLKRFNTVSGRRHLLSLVARDHMDLRTHMQRISLLLDSGDPEDTIFGALVDLFLALGDKGYELRKTVLKQARPKLHDAHFHFLHQRMTNGLQRLDVLPVTMGSVLDRAVFGNSHLVERKRNIAPLDINAVDIALIHLEDGDIKSACDVLETALFNDSTNVAVEAELLEIYRRCRDEVGFLNMRQRLVQNGVSLGADWDEL